ncbi:hypothetical protein [Gimesia sp.]|uniref:hypothetical protein n=1 Tax=Gimesia sp. TaxID=2024833 RepID=UPI0032EDAEC8
MTEIEMSNKKRRTRSENAEFVINSIRELKIEPHPQSRLMKMHNVLTEANGIIPHEDLYFETALEAERDLQLLGFCFEQTNRHPDFKKHVKRAIKDSVLPQEDRGNSPGRDIQFELFIAAVCQNAELNPVRFEEPDITCTLNGRSIGIAAKRLKNDSNLKQHVKKAAKQISTAKLPGIIAIDTCLALNRDNERITKLMPDDLFGELYQKALMHFIQSNHRKLNNWIAGKPVLGFLFHDHQVRMISDVDWELSSMTVRLKTEHNTSQESHQFQDFEAQYVTGLTNLVEI